jgi:hypothetical protein
VYVDLNEKRLSYGIRGEGATVEEAKEDFLVAYEEMRESFSEDGQPFVEASFEFEYDMASFLNYYSKVMSLAGLSRITGINCFQLSHYATGKKQPRPDTVHKIETALHNLSAELSQVRFSIWL